MTRLLLKIYLAQLLLAVLVFVVGYALLYPQAEADNRAYLGRVTVGVTALIGEQLAAQPLAQWPAAEQRLSKLFGFPVRSVPADALDQVWSALPERERALAQADFAGDGQAVAFSQGEAGSGELLLLLLPEPKRVIVVGPMPDSNDLSAWLDLALIAALGVGLWLTLRPLRRRLQALSAAALAFGRGDFSARSHDKRRDALGEVGGAFNAMAAQLAGQFEKQRALLRAVAHELRTPLARLRFCQELLVADDAQDSLHARDARQSLDELETLVDELLVQARLDYGTPLALAEVDVGALVSRLLTDARDASTVPVKLAGGVTSCRVRAEPTLLGRALWNLLSNAQRHARTQVVVSVERDAGRVRIHVDDDGAGITAQDRDRIFEPFIRLDTSRDRRQGGMGLGLSIARQALRAFGGSIDVRDSALGGCRFTVELLRRAAEGGTGGGS